jgi:hypothetical protein
LLVNAFGPHSITVEITEPTSDVAHQKADDQTELERTRFELPKSDKTGNGFKANRICFDGFACIALLSRDLDLGGIIGGMIPSGLGTHFDVSKQCDTFLDVSKQCDTFRFKANAISLF